MPAAVSTITQSGQISLPKQFRDILGVKPHDQVAFLSDGKRVEIIAVPADPLTLGTREDFLADIAKADAEYAAGDAEGSKEVIAKLRNQYAL